VTYPGAKHPGSTRDQSGSHECPLSYALHPFEQALITDNRVSKYIPAGTRGQPGWLPSVSGLDLEDELVLADADPVAVGERDAASDSTALYVNAVGGAQIGNDESSARVAYHGVVAACDGDRLRDG
jgi:hypothetical protein